MSKYYFNNNDTNDIISKRTYIRDRPIQLASPITTTSTNYSTVVWTQTVNPTTINLKDCATYNYVNNYNGSSIIVQTAGALDSTEVGFIFINCAPLTLNIGNTNFNIISSVTTPIVIKILYVLSSNIAIKTSA